MYTSCVTESRFDHPIKGEWEVQKHFEPLDGYLTCHIINKDVYSTGWDPWDQQLEQACEDGYSYAPSYPRLRVASNQCSLAWTEGAVAEQQGSWLDTNIGNYYCGRGG